MTTHSAFNADSSGSHGSSPSVGPHTQGTSDSTAPSNGSLSQKPFRLFSEGESSKFAGVSLDTIRQYERYGLLSPVKKGIDIFYKESELRALFGVTGKGSEYTQEPPHTETTPKSRPTEVVDTARAEQSSPVNFASKSEQVIFESSSQSASALHTSTPHSSSQQSRSAERLVGAPQPELSSGLYEMMEVTRTLREQIQTLKEERDWLRTRVEKLETRGERDQMLIIAENETVKAVLSHKPEKRRSFWGLALPWIKE